MASSRPSLTPVRRLTMTYLGALVAVGAFVFAGERAIQASLQAEEPEWIELSTLERERAVSDQLVQSILLGSRASFASDSKTQCELSAAQLDELLLLIPDILNRPGRSTMERRSLEALSQIAQRTTTALRVPLDEAPHETQVAVLRELDEAAESALKHGTKLSEAFTMSSMRARSKMNDGRERTSDLATVVAGLLALTLLLEAWFLFRPLARKFGLFLKRQSRMLEVTRGYEQRARELAQTKESFLANVSHEIRTPLHGVLGMTEILKQTNLDTRQREYIGTISSCGKSLLHLVNDVLVLAKIEAGEMELESIEFDPRALIEGVLDLASPTLQTGVDLFFIDKNSLPEMIIGDPERLRQVLANLISNAAKFTTEGEIVVIARCVSPRLSKHVSDGEQRPLSAWIEIEVQDSGMGLPEGSASRLFHEFTQADASTTRKHGGTGLGLSICRQLCTAMGGDISAMNRPSGGSTFRFSARVELSEPWPVQQPDRIRPNLRGRHVLCVDEHPLGRRLLREKLEQAGALVDSCADEKGVVPRLAGARLAGVHFDAIVFDNRSGSLDLEYVRRALRERSLHPGLVIIDPLRPAPYDEESELAASLQHVSRPMRTAALLDALEESMLSEAEKPKVPTPQVVPESAPQSLAERKSDRTHRVLIAEDNAVNQKIAVMTLKRLGCDVEVVCDGRAAVKEARKRNFDIIFMDCQMPVMDGFDATRAIRREEPESLRVPIVALTANVFAEDRERCLESGMDGFLPKPVTSSELREILDRFASKERLQEGGRGGL